MVRAANLVLLLSLVGCTETVSPAGNKLVRAALCGRVVEYVQPYQTKVSPLVGIYGPGNWTSLTRHLPLCHALIVIGVSEDGTVSAIEVARHRDEAVIGTLNANELIVVHSDETRTIYQFDGIDTLHGEFEDRKRSVTLKRNTAIHH